MDKKSFIRGFGVGVIFAVVILGVSFVMRTSDSAIISKARKLGMTFESSDTQIAFSTAKPASGAAASAGKKATSTAAPATTSQPKATSGSKVEGDNSDADSSFNDAKDKLQNEMDDTTKSLTIDSGDWSTKVSQELEDIGVIDDADAFNDYLKDNGYTYSIRTGTYDISADASFDEIAKEITKSSN